MQTGSFGDVIFEVSASRVCTPASFATEMRARYEDHAVQGACEMAEFLAPGLDTATLGIVLRRDMGLEPLEEMNRLAVMLQTGEVGVLVIAQVNMGEYTLRKISQDWQHMTRKPGPLRIAATLELKQYY